MAVPELEDRFAPRLPGPIRAQVEKVETDWAEEARRRGMTEEELKAEEEAAEKKRLEDLAASTGKTVEEILAEEEAERQRLEGGERHEEPTGEIVSKTQFDELQHQFNVLKGKYDAEKGPDVRQQLQAVMDQNAVLREQLKLATEKKPAKVSLRQNPKIQALKDEFAPEVFENLVGALEETVGDLKTAQEEEIKEIKGEVSRSIGSSREEIFWGAVFEKHPNYDAIRVDPKFNEFLSQEEGMSGYTKMDFLMDSFRKLNATRVIKYLDAFAKSQNPPSFRSQPNEDKLKRRIGAPAPAGSAQRRVLEGAKKVTKEEVQKANADLEAMAEEYGRGLWRGREKEYEKKEAELWGIIDSGPPPEQ